MSKYQLSHLELENIQETEMEEIVYHNCCYTIDKVIDGSNLSFCEQMREFQSEQFDKLYLLGNSIKWRGFNQIIIQRIDAEYGGDSQTWLGQPKIDSHCCLKLSE